MLRIASMWRLTQWTASVSVLGALALTSGGAVGQERGLVRPDPPVLREAVSGMPRGGGQEKRGPPAARNPGGQAQFPPHPLPVPGHDLESTFTPGMQGRG